MAKKHFTVLSACLLFVSVSACASPPRFVPVGPPVPVDSFVPQGINLSAVPGVVVNVAVLSAATEQVNVFNASGKLLASAIVGGNTLQVLPMGLLASKVNQSLPIDGGPKADAVTCPCNARVIYSDPYVEIIAVFDQNGNIASMYMVMKNRPV